MPSSATSAGASSSPSYRLALRRPDSVLEVIGQLWARDGGARGVWKGSNAAFLYAVLSSLLENWSRSCLSALFDVPDVGELASTAVTGAAVASGGSAGAGVAEKLLDLAAPYPWASLAVAAAAAVCTGLLLAPLDMVKTRYALLDTSSS